MFFMRIANKMYNVKCLVLILTVVCVILITYYNFNLNSSIVGNVGVNIKQLFKHTVKNSGENCTQKVDHFAHSAVNNATLVTMFEACLDAGNTKLNTEIDSATFNAFFQPRIFNNMKCEPITPTFSNVPTEKVALASFPGSGNTWTRHLIEQITGVYTGSIYKGKIRHEYMLGETLCPNSDGVYVIKTHLPGTSIGKKKKQECQSVGVKNINYTKAILLIRNPYSATVAEYNRESERNHTGVRNQQEFKSDKWSRFADVMVNHWYEHSLYWLNQTNIPVHVLQYELLQQNMIWELYRTFQFLQYPITFKSLWCVSRNAEGHYHRQKPEWMTNANLFAKECIQTTNNKISVIEDILKSKYGITDQVMDTSDL